MEAKNVVLILVLMDNQNTRETHEEKYILLS